MNKTKNAVRLVADIGGTFGRFAVLQPGSGIPQHEQTLLCADFEGLNEAVEHYLAHTTSTRPAAAAIAIASTITGDQVKMTNQAWKFSIEQTRKQLKLDQLIVLNDFTALAMALPYLPASQLRQIGGGSKVADAPLALIGAGTGLGVSGLIPCGSKWVALQGEGGHVSFSPANEREIEILKIVQNEYPHVSAERLISGIGYENLYRAISQLNDVAGDSAITPEQISERAISGNDKLCVEVLDTFCAMLGTAAGNLALTLGARGGVYIGGGIVPKLGPYFDASPFRMRFEAKGRFSEYLQRLPTFVIESEHPALIGATQALAE
ncbi:MAG: glucokinase [Burkholderiales bacterium]